MQATMPTPLQAFDQAQLAEVISVNDPDGQNRVKIKLHALEQGDQHVGQLWARVAVPFAGNNRGSFLIPDVGDEVLVTFINGDTRYPVVIGSMWNGRDSAPETLGGDGESVDRWSFVGKAGTRVAIEEQSGASPTVKITTPQGSSVTITDEAGGKIECLSSGNTITLDSSGVTIQAAATVNISGSTMNLQAGMINVDAGLTNFSGVVKCPMIMADSVVGLSYTPGAGNVW